MGDQVSYGTDAWIGYVYDGVSNFNSADYQGYITESANFDQAFCGATCTFATNGCDVNTETFTVRYKMRKDYTCGTYKVTVSGDDGVRLSFDGGTTYVINQFSAQAYTTYTSYIHLDGGTYDMVLDYFENTGQNRVSVNTAFLGSNYGGAISGSQSFCGTTAVNPAPFASIANAGFCTGSTVVNYQWQISADQASWSDVAGATSATYDIPTGYTGRKFYRRRADDGIGNTTYTNTLNVVAQVPTGDQVTYGNGSWIGYVYDGMNNYTDYKGQMLEAETFNETFGGDNTTFSPSGCDVYTETFSVRFKMQKKFECGEYTFTIGGDDGVRLSIDGGSTYLINYYSNHSYDTRSSASVSLDGTYDLVLEYFENDGNNRVSFSYTKDKNCALPVTLTRFDANFAEQRVHLHWTTAQEINNDYFQVERSADGKYYQTIGQVKGQGSTTDEVHYTFADTKFLHGVGYYRLKQVDFDGKYKYSNIISVQAAMQTEISIYPNPANHEVQISFGSFAAGNLQYSISNMQGYVLKSGKISSIDNSTLNVGDLQEGLYICRLQNGDQIKIQPLIIAH